MLLTAFTPDTLTGCQNLDTFHLFNRPNTDTPLMLHLFVAPSVSVLTGFDCLDFQDVARWGGEGSQQQQSCPLTFKFVPTGLIDKPVRDSRKVFLDFSQ